MSQNENEPSDAEDHPSIGEEIRRWAVPAACIVWIVVGGAHGISYIVRSEIEPVKQTLTRIENRITDRQFGRQAENRVESRSERLAGIQPEGRFDTIDGDDQQNAMTDTEDEERSIKNEDWLSKIDKRFDRLDDSLDRLEAQIDLNTLMINQVVETVKRMERKLDAALMHGHRGKGGQPHASPSDPDSEASDTPLNNSEPPKTRPEADRSLPRMVETRMRASSTRRTRRRPPISTRMKARSTIV